MSACRRGMQSTILVPRESAAGSSSCTVLEVQSVLRWRRRAHPSCTEGGGGPQHSLQGRRARIHRDVHDASAGASPRRSCLPHCPRGALRDVHRPPEGRSRDGLRGSAAEARHDPLERGLQAAQARAARARPSLREPRPLDADLRAGRQIRGVDRLRGAHAPPRGSQGADVDVHRRRRLQLPRADRAGDGSTCATSREVMQVALGDRRAGPPGDRPPEQALVAEHRRAIRRSSIRAGLALAGTAAVVAVLLWSRQRGGR